MEYRTLGQTDLRVSVVGLGTMTWGEQNSQAEAFEQLDYAVEQGVNFIDTAEMYPVPPTAETCGKTEQYLGEWLHRHGRRDQLVIASKVAGPADWLPYLRDGNLRLNRAHMTQALDDSLRRLQTDYIDLYQLHWPERTTNYFGDLGYRHNHREQPTPIEETLGVLAEFVKAGKVRTIGLSNETPWGIMRFLQMAEQLGLPRVVSVQNPYSLLNRTFEIGCSEISHREHVGLLAYSPLAFGVLTGKYLDGQQPADARLTRFTRFSRYSGPVAAEVTDKYVALAKDHRLDPAQMALAYVHNRQFVTSTLIGATTMPQLTSNIASIDIKLTEGVLAEIEQIHRQRPNPCP